MWKQKVSQSNKGFSMITVLLAVSLAAILGLLVLYIALANFRMKVNGLGEKDSFYTAEQALEEVRTGLQQDVAEAAAEAYQKVMEKYSDIASRADIAQDAQRETAYKEFFVDILKKRLLGAPGEYNLAKLEGYIDVTQDEKLFDSSREDLYLSTVEGKNAQMTGNVDQGVLLKNLKVVYVNARGEAAMIETDLRLGIPGIQYPTPSTLPDLMNMIVVADHGIVIEGDQSAENALQGSVYAGNVPKGYIAMNKTMEDTDTSIWLPNSGRVTFSNGERVVTKGKINIGNMSRFTISQGTTLWSEGIDLTSSSVELLGKTFLSDDLTVSKGSGSYVKIRGEYYGYGDAESARASRNNQYYTDKSDTDLSSAMVINGRDCTLDLSEAERVLLAGQSYVASAGLNTEKNRDVGLGESITVKGGQLAYLLPEKLMSSEPGKVTLRNPMEADLYESAKQQYSGNFGSFALPLDTDVVYEEFHQQTLLDIGLDPTNPIQEVYYQDGNGKTYVYFYLNFATDEARANYMSMYYGANETGLGELKDNLAFYFGKNGGIKIGDLSSYMRFVTRGNVITYETSASGQSAGVTAATQSANDEALQIEEKSYQNMWYALNRKMIGSVDLLNASVTEDGSSEKKTHDETDGTRSVYDNLVNQAGLVKFIDQNADRKVRTDKQYTFTDQTADGFMAIMAHNSKDSVTYVKGNTATGGASESVRVTGSGKELVIDNSNAGKLRLVVCTGDVVIKKDVEFKGIIMTGGTIRLEPGARLLSAPLEAAQIFQAQMDSEEAEKKDISPKSFFWDGDSYVLGNGSKSGSDSSRDTDTYHIEDYITYENWNKK